MQYTKEIEGYPHDLPFSLQSALDGPKQNKINQNKGHSKFQLYELQQQKIYVPVVPFHGSIFLPLHMKAIIFLHAHLHMVFFYNFICVKFHQTFALVFWRRINKNIPYTYNIHLSLCLQLKLDMDDAPCCPVTCFFQWSVSERHKWCPSLNNVQLAVI